MSRLLVFVVVFYITVAPCLSAAPVEFVEEFDDASALGRFSTTFTDGVSFFSPQFVTPGLLRVSAEDFHVSGPGPWETAFMRVPVGGAQDFFFSARVGIEQQSSDDIQQFQIGLFDANDVPLFRFEILDPWTSSRCPRFTARVLDVVPVDSNGGTCESGMSRNFGFELHREGGVASLRFNGRVVYSGPLPGDVAYTQLYFQRSPQFVEFGSFTVDRMVFLCEPESFCAADINGDRVLDFADVSEFITLFQEPCPPDSFCAADLNDDGAIDFADVSEFLSLFALGCP